MFLSKDIPRKKYKLPNVPYAKVNIEHMSRLAYYRCKFTTKVNSLLSSMKFDVSIGSGLGFQNVESEHLVSENLTQLYNNQFKNKMIEFVGERSRPYEPKVTLTKSNKFGVVFCGRQAPGGLNVIGGLLAFCKKNSGSLYGFRNGTKGLFEGNYMEIDEEYYELYQNQGGFHLLGRSSDSIQAKDFPKV